MILGRKSVILKGWKAYETGSGLMLFLDNEDCEIKIAK